jgi:excisionase family DNA binding protein
MQEAASEIGVDWRTIQRWIRAGRLPVVRLARNCVRVMRVDLQEFLESRRTPAKERE